LGFPLVKLEQVYWNLLLQTTEAELG
jgi:hypothetical protein